MSHFDYVTIEDLENIGMGKPGARRLIEAVKKRKTKLKSKNLVNKILPASISQSKLPKTTSSGSVKKTSSNIEFQPGVSLTCLIQEKVNIYLSILAFALIVLRKLYLYSIFF